MNKIGNKLLTMKEAAAQMKEAMKSGDADAMEKAWESIGIAAANKVLDEVQQDIELYRETQDESILQKRGHRILTSKEENWYNKIIGAMKSANPKQTFAEIIGSDNEDDLMPPTIMEDVFRQLEGEHPLLSKIHVQNVGYLTRWILNNHTAQSAVWGAITDEIAKEITSDFRVMEVKQNKLSCFAILELGMADLGPAFLDSYIRTTMKEAIACALELAALSGTGKNMPVGMDRDMGDESFNQATGWKKKEAIAVTSFQPKEYGALLARFARDENGKSRKFGSVAMIVNQEDYLTKIMPATTALNNAGAYVNNLYPFPTEVIISNYVENGEAVMGLLDEYHLLVGKSRRNNAIEYSDEYKFLEDQRVFKVITYADGRPWDNTSFLVLDISGLDPAYITVKSLSESSRAAGGAGSEDDGVETA